MAIQIEESQLKTIIGQLETAKVLTPAKDRGLIQGPIDTLTRLLGTPVSTAPVKAGLTPRASVADLTKARGTNWSCYEDGRQHTAPSASYLARVKHIRLPITWDYTKAEIDALLTLADSVSGAVVWVECHSYGRVGNARDANGVTTGPLATPAQIAAQAVRIYQDFGHHVSFRLMLDNEPMQQPGAWEQCSQAAVTALGSVGYTGVLVVPLALASNVGAGPSRHPKPWITAPRGIEIVYNGHHYPSDIQDERTGQSVADLDKRAQAKGFATATEWIRNWFNWGLLGSAAWKDANIIIGETAFVIPEHLALYLSLAAKRGVGVFLWADGVWSSGYGYKVSEDHLKTLDAARASI